MCECRPIQTYRGRELKTLLRVSIGIYYIDIKIVNHITFIEIRSVVSEISAFNILPIHIIKQLLSYITILSYYYIFG